MTEPDLDPNTRMAAERTRLAYERTLMAWVRTCTSMIAFGFTIYQLFAYLQRKPELAEPVISPGTVGVVMMVAALVALVLACIQHHQGMRALRAQFGAMPRSVALVIAGLIAVLGVIALLAVSLRR